MGNGVCSRRQRKIFQSLLLVTVVFGIIYGSMVSYEMHKQLKRTEAMALKYQQHQESLSAQLQVVYEHRSRLEKSLQKERVEHKKAKEDYLVYKLESQQSLNKEKQDASSRFNSLHVQHQMLKNQHDDLKKQYYELQEQHQIQGEDHGRALEEHKVQYEKLQQAKDLEMSKLKENVYNLREENKQLRKAHQDIHLQLQDAHIQHMDLKTAHDKLVLTLEDHKSALATAQIQVDEFKRLKETLNRMPSLQHTDQNHPQQQGLPAAVLDRAHVQDPPQAQQKSQVAETHKEEHAHDDHLDTQSKLDLQDKGEGIRMDLHSQLTISDDALPEKEGDVEGEGEAERRRELAEEEMEQAGQPQKLEEESDQPQDEEDEGVELEDELPDDNALDHQRRQPQPDPPVELHHETHVRQETHSEVERVKSAYEQQKEQQRLEAHRAQERRALQLRQEALKAQREKEQREREQRLKELQEKEALHNQEADKREQLLREEHLRRRSQYENMDNDIAQGEDDPHADEEEEKDTHLQPEEGDEKHNEEGHRVPVHQEEAVEGEVDPEDDPNNQGEDEFEEAEEQQPQHRAGEEEEEGALSKHTDTHPNQLAVDEELVMAVNPDQQEDTLDEQEEGEDEVLEDLAGAQKREDEVEEEEEEGDPYNEENLEQDDEVKEQAEKEGEHKKETENNIEENYEEEEEEEEEVVVGRGKHTNRRAEM